MGGDKGLRVKKAVFYQTKAQTGKMLVMPQSKKMLLCPIIKYTNQVTVMTNY